MPFHYTSNDSHTNDANPLSISIQPLQNISGKIAATTLAAADDATTDERADITIVKLKIAFPPYNPSKEIVGANGQIIYSVGLKTN